MASKDTPSSTASAAQPATATHLPLSELNKASAKTDGTWVVDAFRPIEDKYEYTWQGKPRQGTNFIVTLVSSTDPSQYCQAHLKKTSSNGAKYTKVTNSIKNGARFIMSKVGFVEDVKLAYVSCPLKIVVDLSSTKMDAFVEAPCGAVQPAPTATIAGSVHLAGNQFFDVTALIQDVSEVHQHANNRSSFVVKIYDGSLDEDTNKIKAMPLRIYFDTEMTPSLADQKISGEMMKDIAELHLHSKTAMSFFAASVARKMTRANSLSATQSIHSSQRQQAPKPNFSTKMQSCTTCRLMPPYPLNFRQEQEQQAGIGH